MSDVLYRASDIDVELAATLTLLLPAGVTAYAKTLPAGVEAPYVLLTISSPRTSGPMMAGDQQSTVTVQALSVSENDLHAHRIGDAVRELLTGRDGSGAFTTALPFTGRRVLDRAANPDGAPARVDGLEQWSESFDLTLVRA